VDFIVRKWRGFVDFLVPLVQFVSSLLAGIMNAPAAIIEAIGGLFGRMDGWLGKILNKLSKLPGFGFLRENGNDYQPKSNLPAVPTVAENRRQMDTPVAGGRVSQSNTNYGGITINNSGGLDLAGLEEELALAAG
jgi:hypothetical protein